jgi:IclR family acetate operon transcriptional repressor
VAVKRSQSASRAFAVFELIAAQQPIGMSAIAKLLDEDKSAVQRAIATLADAGWIQISPIAPNRWEVSARIFAIAHLPHSAEDLRHRARRVLEHLRDATGETAFLAIPDVERFVLIELADSPHALRMVLRVGEIIPVSGSATGRAVLPFLAPERRRTMLGGEPSEADQAQFTATRARGYGLSVGEVQQGSTNLAAPIFDRDGDVIAALGVSGPSERFTAEHHATVGELVVESARSLSRNVAEPLRAGAANLIG